MGLADFGFYEQYIAADFKHSIENDIYIRYPATLIVRRKPLVTPC